MSIKLINAEVDVLVGEGPIFSRFAEKQVLKLRSGLGGRFWVFVVCLGKPSGSYAGSSDGQSIFPPIHYGKYRPYPLLSVWQALVVVLVFVLVFLWGKRSKQR